MGPPRPRFRQCNSAQTTPAMRNGKAPHTPRAFSTRRVRTEPERPQQKALFGHDRAFEDEACRGRAQPVRKRRLIVAKLIYSSIASLDGYIADEDGNFDWAEPDEEVHTFI